jgi:hypothetical protein
MPMPLPSLPLCPLCPLCPWPTLWWIQRYSIDYLHALAMPCVCPARTPGYDVFATGLSLACPSPMPRPCLSFARGPRRCLYSPLSTLSTLKHSSPSCAPQPSRILPVSLEAPFPSLHVHEASLALSQIDLMVLQSSQCNEVSLFQSVCVNVLQSALVPGSIFNNTPNLRRSSWLFF